MASSCFTQAEIESHCSRLIANQSPLLIFGYASVVWDQGFRVNNRIVGRVAGFKRRFYQGSVHHRGSAAEPGRVATLVPKEGATVYGVAFEIVGVEDIRAALAHLTEREVQLGGYGCHRVSFQPLRPQQPDETAMEAFAFIAGPENPLYLGKASLELQARQVATAKGFKGSNVDYVRNIAEFMLAEVPDAVSLDAHLFSLLRRIKELLIVQDSIDSLDVTNRS